VARKGEKRPIFEGNMPKKKMYPKIGADIGAITGILLSLSRPFNTGYRVKYPFFARFLALCRARGVTIPTICMGSSHFMTPMCIVGIVIT
jgi:hypothetical protein